MIRASAQYLGREVAPRCSSIISSAHLWIALAAAIAIGSHGEALLARGPHVGDSVMIILTYAAIALGFCIAGLTLALSLERGFGRILANSTLQRSTRNAYADLVFVFSWTAVVHWLAIVSAVGLLIVNRGETFVLEPGASIARRVAVGVAVFFSLYGICQFLITVITLSQVADVYVAMLRRSEDDKNEAKDQSEGR